MTENEKIELFDKWYDENYDEWVEGEEGIALREELEQAFKGGIANLEKENAELEEKISVLLSCKNCPENKGGLLCQKEYEDKCLAQKIQFIKELQEENAELKEKLKTAYRKGMRHMAKALKDYDRTDGAWTDYFEHTVDKVLQREQLEFEEYGTLADQLTKAKELLAKWVELFKPKGGNIPPTPIQVDTEQFISEVEK